MDALNKNLKLLIEDYLYCTLIISIFRRSIQDSGNLLKLSFPRGDLQAQKNDY